MTMTLVPTKAPAGTLAVTIRDIHCCECAWWLQMSLEAVKGVAEADVDCDEGTATITFYSDEISRKTIVEAIQSVGYEVHESTRTARTITLTDPAA